MRQLQTLLWKESREAQLFLWIAWGLFIGLPIIGGLEQFLSVNHRFEFSASPWIYPLGPVLAIVIGVAVTCRDLQPKLEDFWQSRPMGAMRLFIVKYTVAATIVLLACGVPLLIEITLGGRNAVRPGVLWTAFLWLASFSISFAAGCILRRTAYAASLAIVGLLLLIFVPVVVPPLSEFNVAQTDEWSFGSNATVISHGPQLKYAAGMLGVSLVMAILGLAAVRRHWHLRSSKPLIYSTLAAAFFILLLSASYQLGTNLPILQHVSLRDREFATSIEEVAGMYNVYSSRWYATTEKEGARASYIRSIAVEATRMVVSPPQQTRAFNAWAHEMGVLRSSRSPLVGYYIDYPTPGDETFVRLIPTTGAEITDDRPKNGIELWRTKPYATESAYMYLSDDRLYIAGKRSMVFDIRDPLHPRKLSDDQVALKLTWYQTNDPTMTFELPYAQGLTPLQRLKFLADICSHWQNAMSPDCTTWCRASYIKQQPQGLAMYHLRSLDDHSATYDLVATYTPSLVQTLVGQSYVNRMAMHGSLLYVTNMSQLAVFDLSGPHPLRLIAHFVAEGGIQDCLPLADGRSLLGGGALWLLGPPPQH